MTTKALEEQRKRVSSRQGDIPSLKSICAKLRRQRNFTCSKRVWKPMLLVIRRELGVLFAKEEGVVKERKIKKKKIVFEHLMLSEKNNEFNCLKATTFVTQVWIIENIFKEKSLQNVGCDSACSFSSHTAAHRDTHSPVLRATNLATLHTFS